MEDIQIVNVQAVRMPNNEIICMGKSLGFVGDGANSIPERYVEPWLGRREVKIIVQGGVPYLQESPDDTEVMLLDEDNGDEDYKPMDRGV